MPASTLKHSQNNQFYTHQQSQHHTRYVYQSNFDRVLGQSIWQCRHWDLTQQSGSQIECLSPGNIGLHWQSKWLALKPLQFVFDLSQDMEELLYSISKIANIYTSLSQSPQIQQKINIPNFQSTIHKFPNKFEILHIIPNNCQTKIKPHRFLQIQRISLKQQVKIIDEISDLHEYFIFQDQFVYWEKLENNVLLTNQNKKLLILQDAIIKKQEKSSTFQLILTYFKRISLNQHTLFNLIGWKQVLGIVFQYGQGILSKLVPFFQLDSKPIQCVLLYHPPKSTACWPGHMRASPG